MRSSFSGRPLWLDRRGSSATPRTVCPPYPSIDRGRRRRDAGQTDFEAGALTEAAFDRELASALFDDSVDDRQSQPARAARLLGGEEGLEDMLLCLLRHADARVR